MAGPLAGIRVLEFSQVIAAPFAGQVLADLGASVLKVEPPGGESWRLQTSFAPTESKSFQCLNRGKHDMTLQMATREAQDIVHRLLPEFDAVLINYRPDAAAKFRIDYETLRVIKPDLVYVDLTAFGRRGEWANRPGYDGAVQAVSGLMAAEGKVRPGEGSPVTIAFSAVADYSSGYVLADALISGLYYREKTGLGQLIECSLLATALNLQPDAVMEHPLADAKSRNPARERRRQRASEGAPYEELLSIREANNSLDIYYRAYLTSDGALVIAAETGRDIDEVFRFFGIEREHMDTNIVRNLEAIIEGQTTGYWLEQLGATGIPCGPVNFNEEMSIHPQVVENGWVFDVEHETTGHQRVIHNPLHFSVSQLEATAPSPPLGRDTEVVLTRLGYSTATIADLRQRGII